VKKVLRVICDSIYTVSCIENNLRGVQRSRIWAKNARIESDFESDSTEKRGVSRFAGQLDDVRRGYAHLSNNLLMTSL